MGKKKVAMANILIVDDEVPIQKLIRKILESKGATCIAASNAKQARQLIADKNFEVIISDIDMPGESGFDFVKYALSKYLDTAVIMMTGLNDPRVAKDALEIGVYDYITKPFEHNRVIISVANALRRRELELRNRNHRNQLEILVAERTETLQVTVRELEKAKADIQKREAKYREFVQEASSIMLKLDTEGRIVSVNEFALTFFGYTKEEIINQPVVGTIVPQKEATGRDLALMFHDIFQNPRDYIINQNENMKRNGDRVWISWTNKAVLDEDGQVQGILCVGNDLTDYKKVQDALIESEEKFRSITSSAKDAIIMMDPDGKVSFWNVAAENMFGFPVKKAMNKDLHSLITPQRYYKQFQKAFSQFQETGRGAAVDKTIELTAKHSNGNEFPIELSLSAMKLKGKWHALGIIRDISERRVLEAQLVQAQKLESIGQLAAGIAHEINTPIQYVSYNTRFLKEQFELIDPLFDKYQALFEEAKAGAVPDDMITEIDALAENLDLSFIREEIPPSIEQSLEGVERVSEIVMAMKEFSHPGTEEKTPIDINKAIQSTITVARNEWKYVADLETHLDKDMPLVPCLPGDFNQVILNIVINGAHALGDVVKEEEGQKGTINISTRHDNGWAEVRIQDTGAGIPKEHQARIFDPFFTTKEVGRGTGQGLAISHSVITDKHSGTLNFETEQGKGTTFIIRLPLN